MRISALQDFQELLKDAKHVVVVGNGGIATELVYELRGVSITWVIKHKSISATFVDAGAGAFFTSSVQQARPLTQEVSKRWKYTHAGDSGSSGLGSALGPDWVTELDSRDMKDEGRSVQTEFECEVATIVDNPPGSSHPLKVTLTSGKWMDCDIVVSAVGVDPNTDMWADREGKPLPVQADGGILVNDQLQTSFPYVYAAGDVCTAGWDKAENWFQMRLWTQAKQMGAYAGRCMASNRRGDRMDLDFCFEMFAHVTNFFGFKVILLGRFNAQGLSESEYEVLLRCDTGKEYIKVVLVNNRMKGAILIGETDLEETFENLILNQTDLSNIKDDLLNPTLDVEDYFD